MTESSLWPSRKACQLSTTYIVSCYRSQPDSRKGIRDSRMLCALRWRSSCHEKSAKQADQPSKLSWQRNDGLDSWKNGKCKLQSQGGAPIDEIYTKFTISIHQILAQVKEKSSREGHHLKRDLVRETPKRAPWCSLGLSHNQKEINQQNPIVLSLWNWRNHSSIHYCYSINIDVGSIN